MAYVSEGTGGTITHAGGYTYHTFTASGTFNPTISRSCAWIIVGHGGHGGSTSGGGGGGGGGVVTSSGTLSGNYTVTLTDDGDTTFNGSTALVGGAGETAYHNGGCGGGGTPTNTIYTPETFHGGTGSQGGNGGSGIASATFTQWGGGGGGGGGGAGSDSPGRTGGNGGIGYLWVDGVRYAGGGGGGGQVTNGSGGSGGGGAAGVDGTDGLGGGGGGYDSITLSRRGFGGNGVVVIRYTSLTDDWTHIHKISGNDKDVISKVNATTRATLNKFDGVAK